MCGSCVDESTTTDNSMSTALTSALNFPATNSPESRCNIGSGTTSVILDGEMGVEAESRKLPSSRFKGVVPQPNGRWGAQIYEKHQRVWLGTFNQEEEAARSYDIAAFRFRGRDAVSNLRKDEEDEVESAFLNSHSKAEIVDMLRKHTYNDELEQSKKRFNLEGCSNSSSSNKKTISMISSMNFSSDKKAAAAAREQLFEKAVTPSDVGKLNRLVIPKQHAEKHFPLGNNSGTTKGLLLNFEDVNGKVWRFRYSYWSSSQSYVLTKGWSRFVKEKNLKAADIVSFHKSTGIDKQFYIDLKPRIINNGDYSSSINLQFQPIKMFRLFGVNIIHLPNGNNNNNNHNHNDDVVTHGEKRGRDIQVSETKGCKKLKASINIL